MYTKYLEVYLYHSKKIQIATLYAGWTLIQKDGFIELNHPKQTFERNEFEFEMNMKTDCANLDVLVNARTWLAAVIEIFGKHMRWKWKPGVEFWCDYPGDLVLDNSVVIYGRIPTLDTVKDPIHSFELPKQRRCVSHKANLLSKDFVACNC